MTEDVRVRAERHLERYRLNPAFGREIDTVQLVRDLLDALSRQQQDLEVNASLLAKQCDLAREAETQLATLQKQHEELKQGHALTRVVMPKVTRPALATASESEAIRALIEAHAQRAILPVQDQHPMYILTPSEANALTNMRHILRQFATALSARTLEAGKTVDAIDPQAASQQEPTTRAASSSSVTSLSASDRARLTRAVDEGDAG